MTDIDTIEVACDVLYIWHEEGKALPGYQRGRGKAYIAYLLGFTVPNHPLGGYSEAFLHCYNTGNHQLAEQLLGPHGWAALQAALVRHNDRRRHEARRETKRQMRNKKAREFRDRQREDSYHE